MPIRLEDCVQSAGVRLGRADSSGWQSARCPFHEDDSPSLSVNLRTQKFRCHAAGQCGVNGTAVDWLMAEGKSKKEALDLVKPREKVKGRGKLESSYTWWGPDGKRVQDRYVPGFDGKPRDYRWKPPKIPPERLLYPAKPKKAVQSDVMVFCEGARTAEAIASAGYFACGIVQDKPPHRDVLEWVYKLKPQRNKWLLWPDNDDGGIRAMKALADLAPDGVSVKWIDPPAGLGKNGDAANCTADQRRQAIVSAGPMPKERPKPAEVIEMPEGGSNFHTTESGRVVNTSAHNVSVMLEKLGDEVRHDLFFDIPRIWCAEWKEKGVPVKTKHYNRWYRQAELRWQYRPSQNTFKPYLEDIAMDNRYHPIKDYLADCPRPESREAACDIIDEIVSKGLGVGAEDIASLVGMRKVFAAAVRRIYQPGCMWKYVPVLISKQNWMKSTALGNLLPDETWHVSTFDFSADEQTRCEKLRGAWLVEAAELEGLERASQASVKSFLSARVDKYRRKYDRDSEDVPRVAVFIGSKDKKTFLKDSENVRWWPMQLSHSCDPAYVAKHRDRLWGAAVVYERGADLWLDDPEIAAKMFERQRTAAFQDPWEDTLSTIILNGLTTTEILMKLSEPRTKANEMRLSKIMTDIKGYTRSKPQRGPVNAEGKRPQRVEWIAPEPKPEEDADIPF